MKVTYQPSNLILYFSPSCPYCHRVLNAMMELGLKPDLQTSNAGGIALKNIATDSASAKALQQGGGKSTVPCLRIEDNDKIKWLYESLDIIAFLKNNVVFK